MLTRLVSFEASFLGLQRATFSLCPLKVFLLCLHSPVGSSSSYKDTSRIGLTPPHLPTQHSPHFNLITTLKKLSPNMVTIWGTRAWDFNIWILGEHNSAHNNILFCDCESCCECLLFSRPHSRCWGKAVKLIILVSQWM